MTVSPPAPPRVSAPAAAVPRPPKRARAAFPGEYIRLLASNQLGFYRRLAAEGDVVQLRIGRERIVLLNHPDDIKRMLVTDQRSFTKGRGTDRVRALLGNGLLTNEGESHLRQRRLVQPAFHRERIAAYGAVMAEYAERRIARWQAGAVLDIHGEMMAITRDIAGKTLFDVEVGDDAGGVDDAIDLSLQMYRIAVLPMGQIAEYLPIPFTRRVHVLCTSNNVPLIHQ